MGTTNHKSTENSRRPMQTLWLLLAVLLLIGFCAGQAALAEDLGEPLPPPEIHKRIDPIIPTELERARSRLLIETYFGESEKRLSTVKEFVFASPAQQRNVQVKRVPLSRSPSRYERMEGVQKE